MRKEQLVNLQNVNPGQTALLSIPCGPTYERLKLYLTNGLLISMIDLITIKQNGKPVWAVAGSDLLAQNLYEGKPNPTNVVLIDFTRRGAKSSATKNSAGVTIQSTQVQEELFTCLATAGLQQCTMEIKINAATPAGIGMTAWAQESDPSKNPWVFKEQSATYALMTVGQNDIPLPVQQAGSVITKIYLHQSNFGQAGAGSIQSLQIRNNQVIISEGTPQVYQDDQTDYQKMPQPGLFVVDFDLQGMREKWLNTTLSKNVFIRIITQTGPVFLTGYAKIVDPINR